MTFFRLLVLVYLYGFETLLTERPALLFHPIYSIFVLYPIGVEVGTVSLTALAISLCI